MSSNCPHLTQDYFSTECHNIVLRFHLVQKLPVKVLVLVRLSAGILDVVKQLGEERAPECPVPLSLPAHLVVFP